MENRKPTDRDVTEASERIKAQLQAGVETGIMHPAIAQMHEDMISVIKKAVLGGANPSDILMTIVVQGEAFSGALKMQGAR
jgi:hypothetical protein